MNQDYLRILCDLNIDTLFITRFKKYKSCYFLSNYKLNRKYVFYETFYLNKKIDIKKTNIFNNAHIDILLLLNNKKTILKILKKYKKIPKPKLIKKSWLCTRLNKNCLLTIAFSEDALNLLFTEIGISYLKHSYYKKYSGKFLHASGLCKGGEGIIITGNRNTGKSSLAYELHKKGFKFIHDDNLFLYKRCGDLRIAGFGNFIKLREDFIKKNNISGFLNFGGKFLLPVIRKKIDSKVNDIIFLYKRKTKKNKGLQEIKNLPKSKTSKIIESFGAQNGLLKNIGLWRVNVYHKSNYNIILEKFT